MNEVNPSLLRPSLKQHYTRLGVYLLLCLVLWQIPLFNVLHVESCAILATVAFFVSGVSVLRETAKPVIASESFTFSEALGVLLKQLVWLLLPFALMNLSMLWIPNCDWRNGWMFFLLFPVVSVIFATCLALLIAALPIRKRKTLFVILGLLIGVGGAIFDVGFHPQFYTYNPVFGGVLGPIYDEELAIRAGIFSSKVMALLWSFLFLLLTKQDEKLLHTIQNRLKLGNKRYLFLDIMCRVFFRTSTKKYDNRFIVFIVILICYFFSARLGMNTPEWKIAETLGGKISTAHFDIFYDKMRTKPHEVHELAMQHEFRYAQLAQKLAFRFPQRISSFVYPNSEVRAELTGARHTSVAPLWLRQPQMHIEAQRYETVMPHELAHVFSRSFGIPVVNSSASIGLIEGFAVAVEPPDGLPSPHQQVSSALTLKDAKNGMSGNLILAVSEKLSPQGFWGGRGAVSYTTMGSFVQFLIEKYGIERFKKVYAWGNFAEVYQKSVANLTDEWANFLKTVEIDPSQQQFTRAAFGRLSLFEQQCPHYIPPYLKQYRQAFNFIEDEHISEAEKVLEKTCLSQPNFEEAHQLLAAISLHHGHTNVAQKRLANLQHKSAKTWRLLGDAHAILGDSAKAIALYDSTLAQLSPFAYESRLFMQMRKMLVHQPEAIQALSTLKKQPPPHLASLDFDLAYSYYQGNSSFQKDNFFRQALENQILQQKILTSQNPDLLFIWAKWALRVKRFDLAQTYLAAAKQHRSGDIWQRYIADWEARVRFDSKR